MTPPAVTYCPRCRRFRLGAPFCPHGQARGFARLGDAIDYFYRFYEVIT